MPSGMIPHRTLPFAAWAPPPQPQMRGESRQLWVRGNSSMGNIVSQAWSINSDTRAGRLAPSWLLKVSGASEYRHVQ